MGRKVNMLMAALSLTGGIIGFIVGEVMISKLLYSIPHSLLMGLYFGQMSFFVGLMCLIAEIISPILNGPAWRRMYTLSSWKFLVPCTLVMLFIAGMVLQFVYGLNFRGSRKINDVVILMDTSQSMEGTDPQNLRFKAVKNLIDSMNTDNRVSVFVFNDEVVNVQPMAAITDGLKRDIPGKLQEYDVPYGMTNIKGALTYASEHIKQNEMPGRSAMVILISDGGDTYSLADFYQETIAPYKSGYIPVFTVGMEGSDQDMLVRISEDTGGKYYSVENVEGLDTAFTKIYRERDLRLLVGERNGRTSSSMVYGIMRVVFLIIIGVAVGFAVGLIFDNRYLAKGLSIGGAVSGLMAGLILEIGYKTAPWLQYIIRIPAVIILSCVFTFFTFLVKQEGSGNFYRKSSSKQPPGSTNLPGSGAGHGKKSF
ncbi:von Willebrand factor type A domain protein [Oxobacter pfennigii]|uniref:von Willebrand factor type A domain protein n=1 Tax=Oxobacter pfennigii TaxID=36849 RepID=A0A0P8W400_9CLOT|nr:VWA domain-containing protein [Oxobacter pfennigii]KPU43311.1 von Willebrand factor type A domain protein [Oxobacter pfennigii]